MPDTRHSVVGEGTDVGIIGGLAVALWFLLLDTIAGHPFSLPASSARSSSSAKKPDTQNIVFGAILIYTAVHFIVFALLGMGLVAMTHWATENAVVRYAFLPVFLVFEVLFYGVLAVFSDVTKELFPFWTVVTANTLAALSMGAYLWYRHPALRESIRDTPLGAAPCNGSARATAAAVSRERRGADRPRTGLGSCLTPTARICASLFFTRRHRGPAHHPDILPSICGRSSSRRPPAVWSCAPASFAFSATRSGSW